MNTKSVTAAAKISCGHFLYVGDTFAIAAQSAQCLSSAAFFAQRPFKLPAEPLPCRRSKLTA